MMAKHIRKVQAAMERRANTHSGYGPNEAKKHTAPNPGSQNRKKCGYGTGGKR
jgi:hypothetical protein